MPLSSEIERIWLDYNGKYTADEGNAKEDPREYDSDLTLFSKAISEPTLLGFLSNRLMAISSDDLGYFEAAISLRDLYWSSYEITQKPDDLETALSYAKQVVLELTDDNADSGYHCERLETVHHTRYVMSGDLSDLDMVLLLKKMALDSTPLGHPGILYQQVGLAMSLDEHYRKVGDPQDVEFSLRLWRAVVDATPASDSDLLTWKAHLAMSHASQHRLLGNMDDLEASLHLNKEVVDNAPPEHPSLAYRQMNLVMSFVKNYRTLGHLEHLEAAIYYNKVAVQSTPLGHPELAGRQGLLAVLFSDCYQHLGNTDDLNASLCLDIAAVDSTPANDPELSERQLNLAASYTNYYALLNNIEDLESACFLLKKVLDDTPADHPDLAERQTKLAIAYTHCYRHYEDMSYVDSALSLLTAAIDASSQEDPELPIRHMSQAVLYSDLFKKSKNVRDIEMAHQLFQEAVNCTPSGHPKLPALQINLATSYSDRYKRLNNFEDLKSALYFCTKAIDGTPPESPGFVGMQYDLAILYSRFYRQLGNPDDLDTALSLSKTVVDNTPANHPGLAGRQTDLAMSYSDYYKHSGNMVDLEASFHFHRLSVNATPLGDPKLSSRQSHLAISHIDRYRQLGNREDLTAALVLNRAGVDAASEDDPGFVGWQINLAMCYAECYRLDGDIKDLETALSLDKAAVESTPATHPELGRRQMHLATLYSDRYSELQYHDDLETAFNLNKAAVENTPPGHPELAGRQTNLGASYCDMFRRSGSLDDISSAIHFGKAACEGTPAGHPDSVYAYNGLARSYIQCYSEFNNDEDLKHALECSSICLETFSAPPIQLWYAALNIADWTLHYNLYECMKAYSTAFAVLPDLLWIANTLQTRHTALAHYNIPQVTSSAVAAAIQFNEHSTAVEFFERGLSITHRQSLELKDDYTILLQDHPLEASQLKSLSQQLMRSDSDMRPQVEHPGPGNTNKNYNLIAIERKDLIKKIRQYDGFESFMLPASYKSLSNAAKNGPVILLNSASDQTSALIILSPLQHVLCVSLPDISAESLQLQQKTLKSALSACHILYRDSTTGRGGRPANHATSQQLFQSVIAWLWKSLVKPVFAALKENGIEEGRIWWCPSGPFTYLPIHAAAPVDSPYIQSYTPTLGALLRAQNKLVAPNTHQAEIMTAVGVSQIPGKQYMDLPQVKNELEKVKSGHKGSNLSFSMLLNSTATVTNVLQQIKKSAWLHLACHGNQDHTDALKSSLVLSDGNLELRQIMSSSFSEAKFVFLSACQTATGDEKLMNESMHLAGGFIAAGYQGAIGTLWNMADSDGPKVAEVVYGRIFQAEGGGGEEKVADVTQAAEGLHLAIQKLRKEGASFQNWMPYIHLGI